MKKRHPNFSSTLAKRDLNHTLQELEMDNWGEVTFPSYLVQTCHALRSKPLRDFTIEDLRIMIGQNIGLEYLVPLAIVHLQHDPFVAGDFYPGDLLHNVLTVESSFWEQRQDLRKAVECVIASVPDFPKDFRKALLIFQKV